jgi:hypothetical protein
MCTPFSTDLVPIPPFRTTNVLLIHRKHTMPKTHARSQRAHVQLKVPPRVVKLLQDLTETTEINETCLGSLFNQATDLTPARLEQISQGVLAFCEYCKQKPASFFAPFERMWEDLQYNSAKVIERVR